MLENAIAPPIRRLLSAAPQYIYIYINGTIEREKREMEDRYMSAVCLLLLLRHERTFSDGLGSIRIRATHD